MGQILLADTGYSIAVSDFLQSQHLPAALLDKCTWPIQGCKRTALTIMFAAGAASTLLGGMMADRFGPNNVVRLGFVLLIPSLYFLRMVEDPAIATILLLPTAFALFSISGPLVLLGQKYLPNKIGFASGVTLGLAVSIGGLVAPFVGKYADENGLLAAMGLLAFIPVFAAFVVLTLKKPAK